MWIWEESFWVPLSWEPNMMPLYLNLAPWKCPLNGGLQKELARTSRRSSAEPWCSTPARPKRNGSCCWTSRTWRAIDWSTNRVLAQFSESLGTVHVFQVDFLQEVTMISQLEVFEAVTFSCKRHTRWDWPLPGLFMKRTANKLSRTPYMPDPADYTIMKLDRQSTSGERAWKEQKGIVLSIGGDQLESFWPRLLAQCGWTIGVTLSRQHQNSWDWQVKRNNSPWPSGSMILPKPDKRSNNNLAWATSTSPRRPSQSSRMRMRTRRRRPKIPRDNHNTDWLAKEITEKSSLRGKTYRMNGM